MATDPFDLVRKWFQAFNAGDVEALPRCTTMMRQTIPAPSSRGDATQ